MMAGKDSRSMHEYVQGKNAGELSRRQGKAIPVQGSFDDLKLPHQKTKAAPNSGQIRSNGHHQHKSAQEYVQPPAANQDSTREKAFYDTDASSIGASSTTESANYNNGGVPHALQDGETDDDEPGFEAPGSDNGSEGEFDDERCEDEPIGLLNGRQKRMMAQTDYARRTEKLAKGASFVYTKGDSYPETTSGNPSVTESIEIKNHKTKSQEAPKHQIPMRQDTSMRAPLAPSNAQKHGQSHFTHTEDDGDWNAVEDRFRVRRYVEERTMSEYQNQNHKQRMVVLPSQKLHEQAPTEVVTVDTAVSKNTAYRATDPSTNGKPGHGSHFAQRRPQSPGEQMQLQQTHHHEAKSRKGKRAATPTRKQLVVPGAGPDQISQGDEDVDDDQSAPTSAQRHASEPKGQLLDYNAEELAKMDYHKLRAESFDVDPNDKALKSPSDDSDTNLNTRMDAAATLDKSQQVEFFNSLPLSEWEEAGDWFITRFGDMLDKLKTNRREKREAAKVFEDEIQKRHDVLRKKRKQTEDELLGLKQKSAEMLQGTPKKARTT